MIDNEDLLFSCLREEFKDPKWTLERILTTPWIEKEKKNNRHTTEHKLKHRKLKPKHQNIS